MTEKHLYLTGDATELETIRQLAVEAGVSAYWIREHKKSMKPKAQKGVRKTLPTSETRAGKLVLAHMRTTPLREWHTDDLALMLEEHDYSPASISPMMTYLRREGLVNHVAQKVYQLTALGRGDTAIRREATS